MKYCQGPKCHTYDTKDRKRGPKDNKRNETRRRSSFYYLGKSACSMQCERDWFDQHGEQAINHFGRIHEPKVLTQDNAWRNRRDWGADTDTYYVYNYLTQEQRPITEQQYDDGTSVNADGTLNIQTRQL
tara:strand:+ start:331 stop:717 length:387 start_codon:yes stop_codon:yes gene_type:complete